MTNKSNIILLIFCIIFITFSCKNKKIEKIENKWLTESKGIYSGNVFTSGRWANISIQIFENDSILMIEEYQNSYYSEDRGKIEQVKDSIFYVSFNKSYFYGSMKAWPSLSHDSTYLSIDNVEIPEMKLIYTKGNIEVINNPKFVAISNNKVPNYVLMVDIQNFNPITNKKVIFKIDESLHILEDKYTNYEGFFLIIRNRRFEKIGGYYLDKKK